MVLSPFKAYYLAGAGHATAANILHTGLIAAGLKQTDAAWVALQSIIGFAAENAFKAYLATHGISREELRQARNYGHDLKKLFDKCLDLGLADDGIAEKQPGLTDALNIYIGFCGEDFRNFNYRYIEEAQMRVLDEGEATRTALRAINCVLDIANKREVQNEFQRQ